MDVVYLFHHSTHGDEELRYSVRSLTRHAPWVRKVWVFGDRPKWLTADTTAVEHVPHEAIAWVIGCRTPVVNTFLMVYLAALLPDVASDFLLCADDYILLADLAPDQAIQPRYLENLDATAHQRGAGLYRDALWRTYDLLKRFGYPRLNYEVHVPAHLTKRRVLAAARDFEDFITEDRYYGPLAQLAILNHAQRHEGFTPILLTEEGYTGFHFRPFTYDQIWAGCVGKRFLNFDDEAYNADMQRFLAERFPDPCLYETGATPMVRAVSVPPLPVAAPASSMWLARDAAPPVATDTPFGLPAEPLPGLLPPAARCLVLVPAAGGIVPECETGLRELERRGYPIRRAAEHHPSTEPARSRLASDALADGYEETMWIDPDVGFHPDQVERVRGHGLPLCAGAVPRAGQRALAVHVLPGTAELVLGQGGGLVEVLYADLAFLHIRRSVYDAVACHAGLPACDTPGSRPLIPYFQPLVRPRGTGEWYLADGAAFCHRARAAGIPVVVDTTLRLSRMGRTAWSWEEAGSSPRRFATFRYQVASGPPLQVPGRDE
ncbi:MAG: hypothetical protein LC104_00975 [Bacteroidales bacterium]|nr:hypothetical protein [Bacteroidales bacterium]